MRNKVHLLSMQAAVVARKAAKSAVASAGTLGFTRQGEPSEFMRKLYGVSCMI